MLSHKQLTDIKNLQNICETEDKIQLKLNWDLLESRNENETNDFFHYENGELVGFLGLYGFGTKIELCGMVHPKFRRRGIFTQLLEKALEEVKARNYREVLFNAPANSDSAKAFIKNLPCEFAFREYQMKWGKGEIQKEDGVTLREALPEDLETEIQLDVQCFGFLEEEARQYNEQIKRENTQKCYVIEQEGNVVGKVRVFHYQGEAWIYGFAVFPEYQGKGIGRKALKQLVLQESQAGYQPFLEVQADNSNALKLYESCGFKAYLSQDYYRYNK